jgi:hypothetical protein
MKFFDKLRAIFSSDLPEQPLVLTLGDKRRLIQINDADGKMVVRGAGAFVSAVKVVDDDRHLLGSEIVVTIQCDRFKRGWLHPEVTDSK